MRRNPPQPDPDELRLVAGMAEAAVDNVDHAIAAANITGLAVEDEVYQAASRLRWWAARLARRAQRAGGGERPPR